MTCASPAFPRRERELLRLAANVESEDPGLAAELRGIAMHEASAAARGPAPAQPAWRQKLAAIWHTLEVVGHRRAEHEIAKLLEAWSVTRPGLARQLRAALRRGD